MRVLSKLTGRPWRSLATTTAWALVLLLFGIGSFGLWEPHEIAEIESYAEARPGPASMRGLRQAVSDHRKKEREDRRARERTRKGLAAIAPGQDEPKAKPCPESEIALPLSAQLASVGHDTIGGELGARLPLAICGVLIVVLVWCLGTWIAGPRAGLFSGLIALSFPALVLGARQITGDPAAMLAGTLTLCSVAVLLWPARRPAEWLQGMAAFGAVLGCYLGYRASGLLVGVIAPASAIAAAGLPLLLAPRRSPAPGASADKLPEHDARVPRLRVAAVTLVFGVVALVALVVFIGAVYDWAPARAGDWMIFGKTLEPCIGETAAALGTWRGNGDLEINFNAMVETIAFGAFPWAPLAAVAVAALAFPRKLDRQAALGTLIFSWVGFTWLIAGIAERKVGAGAFPALPGLALGVGLWLHRAWQHDSRLRAPLVALFAALGTVVLAKDLGAFPIQLASVSVAGGEYAYPEGTALHLPVVVLGMVFAVAAFAGLGPALPGRLHRVSRLGLPVSVAVGLVITAYLALVWTPLLSRQLSSRHTFDVLERVRGEGEPLGVLGRLGDGPRHYAGEDAVTLNRRTELYEFLSRDERVFALVPVGDLCTLHAAQPSQGFEYYVLDDQNAKHLLVSNRIDPGTEDKNILARTIVRERPADIGTPLSVDYGGKLELIGMGLPRAVGRGDRFELTLYWRVKQKLRRNWNIFVHFDGSSQRFQGDHKPAELFCPATQWRPGDYIVDTIELEAGGLGYPKGPYRVWVGLFTGSAGNWTNMEVTTPGADDADRFPVGTLLVE